MSLSEALSVCTTLREKIGFEVRERRGQITIEDAGMDCRGKSITQRKTYGCKGSQLSLRGPDTGYKEVQPITPHNYSILSC